MNSATIVADGKPIAISDGTFFVPNSNVHPVMSSLSAHISGSVEAVNYVLTRDALKPYASIPLDPANLHGHGEARLDQILVLGGGHGADDTLKVNAKLTNFAADKLIGKEGPRQRHRRDLRRGRRAEGDRPGPDLRLAGQFRNHARRWRRAERGDRPDPGRRRPRQARDHRDPGAFGTGGGAYQREPRRPRQDQGAGRSRLDEGQRRRRLSRADQAGGQAGEGGLLDRVRRQQDAGRSPERRHRRPAGARQYRIRKRERLPGGAFLVVQGLARRRHEGRRHQGPTTCSS